MVDVGVSQSFLFSSTLFLIYINDPPNDILSSLLNIDTDESAVYRWSSKYRDDQRQTADLSSDVALNGVKLTLKFRYLKKQVINFMKAS